MSPSRVTHDGCITFSYWQLAKAIDNFNIITGILQVYCSNTLITICISNIGKWASAEQRQL